MRKMLLLHGWMLLLIGSGLQSTHGFPINGGFEDTHLGKPIAWQVAGRWVFSAIGGHTGARCAILRRPAARPQCKLVSESLKAIHAGTKIKYGGYYVSPQGGVEVGVELCDITGMGIDVGASVTAGPSPEWQKVEGTFEITQDQCEQGARYIRVWAKAVANDVELRLDDLHVTEIPRSTPIPEPYQLSATIDYWSYPELLPNSHVAEGDGQPKAWRPLGGTYDPEGAQWEKSPGPDGGVLRLLGGVAAAGWVCDPVPVELTLPYQLTVWADGDKLNEGRLIVRLLLANQQQTEIVGVYQAELACGSEGSGVLQIDTMPVGRTRRAGKALVFFVLPALSKGEVAVERASLVARPVRIDIRPGTPAGAFHKPGDTKFFISVVSFVDSAITAPVAHLRILDETGAVVCEESRSLVTIAPKSTAYFPWQPKLAAPGDYTVSVSLTSAGRELVSDSTDFVVQSQ